MDETKPVPSLNNFANFDLPSPKGSLPRGSLTGWTDDPASILMNNSKKDDVIQTSPVKKESIYGSMFEPRPQRPIKTVSRKSNTRAFIIKRESSFENTQTMTKEATSIFKPNDKLIDKQSSDKEHVKYKEDSVIVDIAESQAKGVIHKKTSLKGKRRDLKELFSRDCGTDGSASIESRARSSSQTFYPKLKPRQPSLKNKDVQNLTGIFNETKMNRSILGRTISISSPSHKDHEVYVARNELKTAISSKRNEDDSKLSRTIDSQSYKINTKPERKKTVPVNSSKNANNKFMRKNFMGISMLINTSKSGSLKNKYLTEKVTDDTPIHIEGNEVDDDNREVFKRYLNKISRPQRNAIGMFKEKLFSSQWAHLRDSFTSNQTSGLETEKERQVLGYKIPYTKGIENRIKRLETETSNTFQPKGGLMFNSPFRVTAYNSPVKFPVTPNKYVTNQIARIDFNF